MNLLPTKVLLVDGDPLTYRFGIAEDFEEAKKNLHKYLKEVEMAAGVDSTEIYLTAQDCLKGYRYHLARIKPYQGNRSGKSPNLPTRKALWDYLKSSGGITHSVAEADDMLVHKGNQGPDKYIILSPDKDLHQSKAPIWGSEYQQPYHGYHTLLQILSGDRADNIPPLVPGMGPKKAEKFLSPFTSLPEAQQAVVELAGVDTPRLAEISSLVVLGRPNPIRRLQDFWGTPDWLREAWGILKERLVE